MDLKKRNSEISGMPNVGVRRMREKDITAILDLAMLANPHAVKEKYAESILEVLRRNSALSFVAIEGGKVVGYAQADIHGSMGVLEDIAVVPNYQRRGIGKLLLENVLEALKNKGVKLVQAEVHYNCASAIPFYYKHGFRITGFVQDFFGIGHDAIILKLVLQ